MKEVTLRDVEIFVQAEPDSLELVPQWFDEEKAARAVIKRLKAGDNWAWSSVTLRLSYQGLLSKPATTPGCSYKDEQEFRKSPYFEQMAQTCLKDLNTKLQQFSAASSRMNSQCSVPHSLIKGKL
jgi:hypothetical protein